MGENKPARTFDIFPANVVICPEKSIDLLNPENVVASRHHGIVGAKYIETARVIASSGIIYIGVDSSTGPVLIFSEAYTQQTSQIDSTTRFTTESGKIIAASKDRGCGCGSRLKNWSPITSLSRANRRDI
jgi:hypothetical protein